ncbi:Thiamin-phosphate pyrophosphorylase [Sphingobacterium sp. JB170]|nr:Thiamin-phosphate pyrophosphorylase [Sphingobacterium sp. JB170]
MHILTLPGFVHAELKVLREMLSWPQLTVHIRKPELSPGELCEYLTQFTPTEREKLILHGDPEIARAFGVSKIHYGAYLRNKYAPGEPIDTSVRSTSTHSWAEFNRLNSPIEMAFIGPLFPSISKPGYKPHNNLESAVRSNFRVKAIALGGLTCRNVSLLARSSYDDYAFCGAIWQADSPIEQAQRCYEQALKIQNSGYMNFSNTD